MVKARLHLYSANKISAFIVKSPMTPMLSTASVWLRLAKQIEAHCRDLGYSVELGISTLHFPPTG
jgi:hypothetical protein